MRGINLELALIKRVFLGIFVVFFAVNGLAFVSSVPQSIVFNEIPHGLSFSVSNMDSVARELNVQVFLPIQYEFVQKPSRIAAGATETVSIKLFPRRELVSQEFIGTINVVLGSKVAQKSIRLKFLGQTMCPVSINAQLKEVEGTQGKSFEIISKLENHKQEVVEVSFEKISGIPSDWAVKADELKEIGPFEKIVHKVLVTPNSSFDGEADVFFNCDGFTEKRTVLFSHKQNDFFTAIGLVGLFSTGFIGNDFLLNALLVLIAAILLIAFISRLVRKLSVQASQSQVITQNSSLTNVQENNQHGFSSAKKYVSGKPLSLEEIKKKISEK